MEAERGAAALSTAERRLLDRVEGHRGTMARIVESLAARPELGYAEHFAHELLTTTLDAAGLPVESGLAGMPTSFRSHRSGGGRRIAILAEYDALPEIGHACGHNVIAASALGAYLALAEGPDEFAVELLGCPAEESTVPNAGGKIRLLTAGAFADVDVAMMIHPYDVDLLPTEGNLAAMGLDVVFHGRAAHAAMRPEDGVNALNAAVLTYSAIEMARQHLAKTVRIHGIITDGGTSPNVVPERSALRYRMRADRLEDLDDLAALLRSSAEGAARATGCRVEFEEFMPAYAELRLDPDLVAIARTAARDLDIALASAAGRTVGSTDLGNVSHVVPTLEFGIGLGGPGVDPHTPAFAAAAAAPAAVEAAVRGARALALCASRAADRPANGSPTQGTELIS